MVESDSRVTIHMAASLDGFIARKDGRVDWLETRLFPRQGISARNLSIALRGESRSEPQDRHRR